MVIEVCGCSYVLWQILYGHFISAFHISQRCMKSHTMIYEMLKSRSGGNPNYNFSYAS